MRQKILETFGALFKAGNTHLGSVVIGLIGGYLITKSTRQQELIGMKQELDKEKETTSDLRTRLKTKESELQQVFKAEVSRRFETQNCLRRLDFVRYAFGNSYCLFRQRYPKDIKLIGIQNAVGENMVSSGRKSERR